MNFAAAKARTRPPPPTARDTVRMKFKSSGVSIAFECGTRNFESRLPARLLRRFRRSEMTTLCAFHARTERKRRTMAINMVNRAPSRTRADLPRRCEIRQLLPSQLALCASQPHPDRRRFRNANSEPRRTRQFVSRLRSILSAIL